MACLGLFVRPLLSAFQDFESELTKYDYPIQTIKAISSDPQIFSKLEQGLISLITDKEALQQNKNLLRKSADDEEKLLERSLQNLDTLNDAYVKRLLQHEVYREGAVNNLVVPDHIAIKVPELELY